MPSQIPLWIRLFTTLIIHVVLKLILKHTRIIYLNNIVICITVWIQTRVERWGGGRGEERKRCNAGSDMSKDRSDLSGILARRDLLSTRSELMYLIHAAI